MAIVVHPCGFKGPNEICDIAKYRLEEAGAMANRTLIQDVIVSGGLPYRLGSKVILADLMTTYLLDEFPMLGLRIHPATARRDKFIYLSLW